MRKVVPHKINYLNIIDNADDIALNVFNTFDDYGFLLKRFYTIESYKKKVVRGNHAHLNQKQIFLLVKGNVDIVLYDTENKKYNFSLDKLPLFIPENYWIEVYLNKQSKVLCMASESYDNVVTIKNKTDFLS